MAWTAPVDVNDGQDMDGAAVQSYVDSIEELQAAVGSDVPLLPLDGPASGVFSDSGQVIADDTDVSPTLMAVSDPLTWLSAGNVIPTTAGLYKVTATFRWGSAFSAATRLQLNVRKNDSVADNRWTQVLPATGLGTTNNITAVITCNGTTDAIDWMVRHNQGTNETPVGGYFIVELLRGH